MKSLFRKLFWFILRYFETGDEPYNYKPLNRKLLVLVGGLFIALCIVAVYFAIKIEGYAIVNSDVCTGCAVCVAQCPQNAIVLTQQKAGK